MMKVYNRKTKKTEEIQHFAGNKLEQIYKSSFLTRISTSKFISKIYGCYNSTKCSKKKISRFIRENNIDMGLYKEAKYSCFNDFFIREKKNIICDEFGFISPCDAKLLVYKISDDLKVRIKNQLYSLEDLIDESADYKNGHVFVYRLTVDNYHRFHYIDDGRRIKRRKCHGRLHTVSPYSYNYKIYKENEREYSVLETTHFGKIIYMEVGALLIGKIVNYDLDTFKRGEEKGYFLPGGSTVVIIANNIKVDEDIISNSKKDIETIVTVGEKVGEKVKIDAEDYISL